jgi:hypothetical protein
VLDRIEIRALPPSKRTTARSTPGTAAWRRAHAKSCSLLLSGLGQGNCRVERLPMTSGEAVSRGPLHAFQWAPRCLRVLCATGSDRHLHRP